MRVASRSPVVCGMAILALAACLALPATVLAQAVPKLPPQLPAPRAVPKPEVPEIARPVQPAPAGRAAQAPAPPAAPGVQPEGRDPFEPLVTKATEGDRPTLTGVRLVGVVWEAARRGPMRALVETPDGLGYYLRVNEEKFGGKVVAIERDRVRFSVREQDPTGQSRTRTVELKLN